MRNLAGMKLRYMGQRVVAALAMAIIAISSPASAQVDPRVPSGSPLDPNSPSQSRDSSSDRQGNSSGGLSSSGREISQQPFTVQDQSQSQSQLLTPQQLLAAQSGQTQSSTLIKPPPKPGEFERYIERLLGRRLPRFGEDLILPAQRDFATPATATVPPAYIVQPGDRIAIALSGSIQGSVEREVDTNGRIFLPGVGSVRIGGVRNADLHEVISAAIGRQFRGYTVSVTVKQLRGIRVYVTGLANNPGAFTVSSLSTLANAVFQAGGPSAGGSFRGIKLYRSGRQVADFDLYQLMRGGARVDDALLQNEDVIFIPPAGEQVAVIGSVQEEAIYEAKAGESLADMLAAAGGPNTVADRSRLILYRSGDTETVGPQQIPASVAGTVPIRGGDILQLLSVGTIAMPTDRQSVLVRIEGEVNRPGNYFLSPRTSMAELLEKAGGLAPTAYPYGARFTRQSVKLQQQESYREAVRQLELALASAPLTNDTIAPQGDRERQLQGARDVLERLRQAEPDGRVVLELPPDATSIPGTITLENNDSLYVPTRSTTVGVFGAVYRPASFIVGATALRARDYIEKAGGSLRSGDRGQVFLVRASGEVVSHRRGSLSARVVPGDIIFVPVRTQGNAFFARLRDITQTLFQLGLSAATIRAVTR